MSKRWVSISGFGQSGKWEKENIIESFRRETWWNEQERSLGQEFQLHIQEFQDFSSGVAHLITHKSSESRNVDLTNNGMVNHYLRDVDHGSHCLGHHRTACFTYMSDYTSEGTELRGYMSDCLHRTERQRIRTTNKFVGRSGDHSPESVFCSSATRAVEFIFLNHHTVLWRSPPNSTCFYVNHWLFLVVYY